jgi:hypothetical protein
VETSISYELHYLLFVAILSEIPDLLEKGRSQEVILRKHLENISRTVDQILMSKLVVPDSLEDTVLVHPLGQVFS